MSKKDPKLILEMVLRDINLIEDYLKGWNKREFLNSVEKQDSVSKRLENIGELLKKLPENIRKENDDIPWQDITGLRDNMAHEYEDIDYDIIWKVVELRFPRFKTRIKEIKQELENHNS